MPRRRPSEIPRLASAPRPRAARTSRGPEPVRSFFLLFVFAMAVGLFGSFLPTARDRWNWAMHDRGVHALAAIKLATSLRGADFTTFFSELLKPKLYPPLQALAGALLALIAGPHYRVVALPSLLGWMAMIIFGCGLAFRTARPGTRLFAGFITAAFMVASPAHRFYATDTMLESLGAGLTLAALYAYVLVRERPDPRRLRWLALALTLLFFEKYNYWLLVAIALAADLALDPAIRRWFLDNTRRHAAPLIRHLLMQPPLWAALATLIATIFIALRGPTEIFHISLSPPRGLLTAVVWLVALQIAAEFLFRQAAWRQAPAWFRILWLWHGLPLLLWLMLPARLWTILFFVGPANSGDARYAGLAGLRYYALCLADQYSLGWPALLLAAALALVGAAVAVRKPARAVIVLLLVGALLAGIHPNKQGRYLHSWIPALWILSGLGAASLWGALERRSRYPALAGAILASAGLAFWFGRDIARQPTGHDELAQYHARGTLLEATDTYLPAFTGFRRVAIFAPSAWPVVEWTFLERFGDHRAGPKLDLIRWPADETPAQAVAAAAAWARSTPDEAAIVISATDPTQPSLWTRDGYDNPAVTNAVNTFLDSPASGFETVELWRFSLTNTTVTLYFRAPPATATSPFTSTTTAP